MASIGNPFLDYFLFQRPELPQIPSTVSGISRIKSAVATYNNGVLQNNRFLMFITPPSTLRASLSSPAAEESDFVGASMASASGSILPFLCHKVNLPGVQFNSRDVLPNGFGITTKMPYSQSFGPLMPNFLVDTNLSAHNFFTKWAQSVINFGGSKSSNAPNTVDGAQMFDVAYKDDYAATVQIYVYSNTSEVLMEYTFYNAFPVALGDIDLSWDFTNEIMTMPVTINYEYWSSNFIRPSTQYNYYNPGINSFNSLFPSGFNAYSTDSNFNNQSSRDSLILSTFSTRSPLSRFQNRNVI